MVHVRSVLVDIEVPHDDEVCDVLARLQDSLGTKKQKFRLVHQGEVLGAGVLAENGVAGEDSVVALMVRDPVPPVTYADGSSAVDVATINAAIANERAERGQEAESSGQDGDGASDFPFLRRMMHQLAALGGLRPSPGGQVTLEPAQVQTLWDTIDSCLRTTDPIGSTSEAGPSGSDTAMADASATPLPVVDEGALQQLVGMGFPEARSRKALLLRRNSLEAAMEWLLEHGEDPDADTPLSEAQLRALAAPGAARSVVQPDPEALRQLLEMGFDEQQAADALRATFNDQEAALPPSSGDACGAANTNLPRDAERPGSQRGPATRPGGSGHLQLSTAAGAAQCVSGHSRVKADRQAFRFLDSMRLCIHFGDTKGWHTLVKMV
ncbi:hypothetical protein KFL_002090220 [Klebsormidium nitens]|uniref:UBA domain-containing protein n=1 Tax=Klebsormidium nitens TaxID=105231 RepID=A0A1Y1I1S7_KLENI|nr:hypothetical protein KFL_002090220 [Klebsormidium nitens]|eukprot:GAQ84870.1 hypothetical protein KFL_002090220 [Klebsormidium nitens]